MNISKQIVGDRIILRKPETTIETAQANYELITKNREHVGKWMDFALESHTKTAEDCLDAIKLFDKNWQKNEMFNYFIYLNDLLIGVVGARFEDETRQKIIFGYWLDKEHCGRGYATEAVVMLENEFFEKDIKTFIIRTDLDNKASEKIALKLGYRLEKVQQKAKWRESYKEYRDLNIWRKEK